MKYPTYPLSMKIYTTPKAINISPPGYPTCRTLKLSTCSKASLKPAETAVQ
jgi:hypothetical protein